MIEFRDDFIKEITKISQSVVEKGFVDYNEKLFKDSFFNKCSHSPDNLESMEYIEYGYVKIKHMEERKCFGLKIKDKDVLLSDVVSFLENDKICGVIKEEFPELTVKEIEAAQRVISIILLSLECQELGSL